MFPKIAIVDPELTYYLPYISKISTVLDALNQAFESIWNKNRTPYSIFTASKAIIKALTALPLLHKDLNDKNARLMISEASLLAGISISQTFTAICHSISYPLTSHYKIQHGFACAFTMKSIANKVFEEKPNYFTEVVELNGYDSLTDLLKKVNSILTTLKVKEINKKLLKNKSNLLSLKNQIINPSRSGNFILTVNENFLNKLLNESYDN